MNCSNSVSIVFLLCSLAFGTLESSRAEAFTEEQGRAILDELVQIRRLLERQVAVPRAQPAAQVPIPQQRVRVPTKNAVALGRADAPLTLVEFTDLECPFCRQFHLTTFEQLKREYIDTGVLRFVSRDLPLPMHPHALKAANAVHCAAEQDRFWEMRHVLIVNAQSLSAERLPVYARDLGLDGERFDGCLKEDRYQAAVQRDADDARALGIAGTPTFILGLSAPDAIEGFRIVGAQSYETFTTRIKELLESSFR